MGDGVPEGDGDSMLAFWCGWMNSHSAQGTAVSHNDRLEMAIRAAEFIEKKAKEGD
jgi:hypothetical protein